MKKRRVVAAVCLAMCATGFGGFALAASLAVDVGALAVFVEPAPPPPPPELTGTDPGSPSDVNNPRILGDAPVGTHITIHATDDCSGPAAATGTAEDLKDPGIEATVEPDTTTVFTATATGASGASPCSKAITYTHTSKPPGS